MEDIMAMTDESFQDHCGNLTAEEARIQARTFTSAAANDPNHPYVSTVDPTLHKQAVARASRLFEQSHAEDPDLNVYDANGEQMQGQTSTEYLRLLDEAKIEQAEKVDKTKQQMEADMDILVEKYDFSRDAISDNPQPYQAAALRMQRLNHEGKTDEIVPLMEKELKELKASQKTQQLFLDFSRTGDLDPELRSDIFERTLRWIYSARKQQAESIRAATKGSGDE